MITDVYIVYDNDEQIKKIGGTYTLKVSPFFHFIDYRTAQGRKDSFRLKSHWAARENPFVLCMEGDNPIKAFYSESDSNVIKSLIEYLNEQDIHR